MSRKMPTDSVLGEAKEEPENQVAEPALTAERMHVLVAEDDLINSKIIKRRMEKSGHEIQLTSNGEECATAYSEFSGRFDAILMDMQARSMFLLETLEPRYSTDTLPYRCL